jgi:hypothetical protein
VKAETARLKAKVLERNPGSKDAKLVRILDAQLRDVYQIVNERVSPFARSPRTF